MGDFDMSKDTTESIHRMLAERYSGSEWAYLTEAPDGTGMKKQRTADAIAIGLWSKNAGQFHGFEVKSSRSDWTSELQNPEKSRSWRSVVTSFWLVAGRGVAKLQEVPPDWGFLEVANNGESLKIRKQPLHVARESVPLNYVGAMVRRAAEEMPHAVREQLRDVDGQLRKSYNNGRDAEKKIASWIVQRNEQLEAIMQNLTQLLGRSPEYLKADDMTVMLLKAAQSGRLSNVSNAMSNVLNSIKQFKQGIDGIDNRFETMIEEFNRISQEAVTA